MASITPNSTNVLQDDPKKAHRILQFLQPGLSKKLTRHDIRFSTKEKAVVTANNDVYIVDHQKDEFHLEQKLSLKFSPATVILGERGCLFGRAQLNPSAHVAIALKNEAGKLEIERDSRVRSLFVGTLQKNEEQYRVVQIPKTRKEGEITNIIDVDLKSGSLEVVDTVDYKSVTQQLYSMYSKKDLKSLSANREMLQILDLQLPVEVLETFGSLFSIQEAHQLPEVFPDIFRPTRKNTTDIRTYASFQEKERSIKMFKKHVEQLTELGIQLSENSLRVLSNPSLSKAVQIGVMSFDEASKLYEQQLQETRQAPRARL